jgi:3-dehydroquinate synthase
VFAGLDSGLAPHEHLIIDARVATVYSGTLRAALAGKSVLLIEATEASKSLERFPEYVTHLLDHSLRRDHILVAVGGGVIQDITTFLAATLLRGVPWRFYPTTLLAQADSCIGSKSSINVGQYKNQLGTFTPPREIVISTEVLASLADADLRSGLGEMIKTHIIAGWEDTCAIATDYPRLLTDTSRLTHYIRRSLEIKKLAIELDEFDRNERLVMNYGHSFGHAIESATHYAVPHGIAVTIGMDMANYLSYRLGYLARWIFDELHRVLAANCAGFERIPVPPERFFAALAKDKKNLGGDLSVVLMRGPGQVFVERRSDREQFRSLCVEYIESLPARELTALNSAGGVNGWLDPEESARARP